MIYICTFRLYHYKRIDTEGYYQTQLWCLMKDVSDMICGSYSPIEDCNIIFDEVEIINEV